MYSFRILTSLDFLMSWNTNKQLILKDLNEGSIDEINLGNFVTSIYKNIVDISYYLFKINAFNSSIKAVFSVKLFFN